MDTFWDIVLALTAGGSAALISPWAHWGVEKLRSKQEYRRLQIRRWRDYLHSDFDQEGIRDTTVYSEMRQHLTDRTKGAIEGNVEDSTFCRSIPVDPGRMDGANVVKTLLLDDLAQKEREWKLI